MTPHLQTLEMIVRKAGQFMTGVVDKTHTNKTNSKDFVTVADIKSQDFITEELKKHFPGEVVLSEEHAEADRRRLLDPVFTGFVIDPIDGTYNFKRDIRESAISIGYMINGEPDYGVIYDPYKDELYAAEKGKGATRNGLPIRVGEQESIEGASIATSNSYDDAAMARNLKRHLGIYEQSWHMPWTSCSGSGVLIMAYVACGRFDAYHHNGLKPWDNAVAFLLVREAGGVVHDLNGVNARFTSSTVLMGNPKLIAELERCFATLPPELLT